jgi:hypothetical protein
LLVPGKSRCLMCGRPVVSDDAMIARLGTDESVAASRLATGDEAAPANRLIRNVSASGGVYTERIEIHASDSALGQFAPLLMGVASRARQQGHSLTVTAPSLQQALLFEDAGPSASLPELAHLATEIGPPGRSAGGIGPSGHPGEEIVLPGRSAADFFDTVGDTLVPRMRTFKGSTKKECQSRLVVMFAWGYREIYGRPAPTRDLFNKVAVAIGLYDPNWRKYFSRTAAQYLTITPQGYALSQDGERKVREILRDMDDEGVFGYVVADGGEEAR